MCHVSAFLFVILDSLIVKSPFWDGSAPQHFFEARLIPNGDQPYVFCGGGFQANPSLSRNQYERARPGIIFFVSEPYVRVSCLDQKYLFLSVMFVFRDRCATLPALSGPTAHLTNPALRTATVPDGMVDDDGFPLRVTEIAKSKPPMLPMVEEFVLTPPDTAQGASKTTLAVRFPATQAASLASSIPFTLGRQNVVLQRSQQNPNTFVTLVNFDWQALSRSGDCASRPRLTARWYLSSMDAASCAANPCSS